MVNNIYYYILNICKCFITTQKTNVTHFLGTVIVHAQETLINIVVVC